MKRDRVWAVATNELRQVGRGRDYLVPLGFLALLFFVVIPLAMLGLITRAEGNETAQAAAALVDTLPSSAQANVEGDDPGTRASYAIAVYLLAPIAIVVPLTVATAIGSQAVVGERERGTGEFLAHSPAAEQEIYAGKLIASVLPGFAVTLAGFGVYSLIVNLTVGASLGRWFFPTPGWIILVLWVVPPFIVMALAVIVAISARARTVAGAQQASQLVTLPVILVAYFVATGLLFDAVRAALVVGVVAWLAAGLAMARGLKSVDRERLLGVER